VYQVVEGEPFQINEITSLEDEITLIAGLTIAPNPSQGDTHIAFSIKAQTNARIWVTDIMGRSVYQFPEKAYTAGNHQLTWSGTNQQGAKLPSGMYLLTFEIDGQVASERILLE